MIAGAQAAQILKIEIAQGIQIKEFAICQALPGAPGRGEERENALHSIVLSTSLR